jgi:GAF domain-containing protein/anti-sigma regulatory factor (Ser/Thr protein kinase)
MAERRGSPLRTVILLAVAVLVVFDALVLAAAWQAYRAGRGDALRALETEAASMAAEAESSVRASLGALGALTTAPALENLERDRMTSMFAQAADELGFSGGLGWIDGRGDEQLHAGADAGAPTVDLGAVPQARQAARTGGRLVSDVFVTGPDRTPAIALVVGTRDAEGRTTGALVAVVLLDRLPPVAVGEDGIAGRVLDSSGAVVRATEGGWADDTGDDEPGDQVLAARAPVPGTGWTVEVEQPRRLALADAWGDLERAVLLLVIITAGGLAGALGVGVRLQRDDRRLAAAADDERAARQRVERLEGVTLALARAVTFEEVTAIAVGRAVEAMRGDGGGLGVCRSRPQSLEFVSVHGVRTGALYEQHRIVPLFAPAPSVDAVHQGRPVWVHSRDELRERYPLAAEALGPEVRTVGAVPLQFEGDTLGVITVHFERDLAAGPADERMLATIAEQVAQALGRVRLLEDLARRRRQAEALQTFTAAISGAAEERRVIEVVAAEGAAAAGARIANLGIVQPGRGAAVLTHDPSTPRDVAQEWPSVDIDDRTPLSECIRTGQAVYVVDDADRVGRFDHLLEDTHRAGLVSTVSLPLRSANGAVIGALGLGWASAQPFDPEQVTHLEALAQVVAQAVDRASVYERERVTRRRAERLNSIVASLATTSDGEAAAQLLVAGAIEGVGASGGCVILLDESGAWGEAVGVLGSDTPPAGLPSAGKVPGPALLRHADEALRAGRPVLVGSREELVDRFPELDPLEVGRAPAAAVVVPLTAGLERLGVLHLAWSEPQPSVQEQTSFLGILGIQGGQALARVRTFEQEHEIASELQRALLPGELPRVDHVRLAARYVPAAGGVEVGGDWYDAIPFNDGRLMLVVGDVVGHGVRSAAAMGRLASAARALAGSHPEPAALLTALDRVAADDPVAWLATCVAVLVDPATGTARWSTAGHPPPLLRRADGSVTVLSGARSTPLGFAEGERPEALVELDGRSLFVLYTDGLVERRLGTIDEGIETIRAVAAPELGDDPEALEERVDQLLTVGTRGSDHTDDVVVLCAEVRPHPARFRRVVPADLMRLAPLRDDLRAWLRGRGVVPDDVTDLLLAVNEGAANAVEHAHGGDGRAFDVEAWIGGHDDVTVRIADRGQWRVPNPQAAGRGFGMPLMRRLTDEVDVEEGRDGTTVTMRKRVRSS